MGSTLNSMVVAAALLGAGALPASAQLVYVASADGPIGQLNVLTGAYSLLKSNSPEIGGLGFHGGVLYGLGQDMNLYTIDAGGSLTKVGSTGISLAGGWGLGATNDDTLYAQVDAKLWSVNPTTGMATAIGGLAFDSPSVLAGDNAGNLYIDYGDDLYKVSRSDGSTTDIGTMHLDNAADALCWTDGAFYAITVSGDIYRINLADASSTKVSTYDSAKAGYIWAAASDFATPEPFTLALCAGGLGLALARRRKAK